MRFRRDGINHQGRKWEVSEPIDTLAGQVEATWPDRHPTDGTVASSSHSQWPQSDHGPDPEGTVRAIDVGADFDEGSLFFEQLRLSRDPRLRYVIWQRFLFSSYPHSEGPPFTIRPYRGTPHLRHVHVSVLRFADTDGTPFRIDLGGEDLAKAVEGIQRNLNLSGFRDMNGDELTVDGEWGPKTEFAHNLMCEAAAEGGSLPPDWKTHQHGLATVNKTGPVS